MYVFLCDQAVSLLGPPTRFEASKLKVVFMGDEIEKQPLCAIPRAYTLTHCDFTANLTLAVSNNITNDMVWTAITFKSYLHKSSFPCFLPCEVMKV